MSRWGISLAGVLVATGFALGQTPVYTGISPPRAPGIPPVPVLEPLNVKPGSEIDKLRPRETAIQPAQTSAPPTLDYYRGQSIRCRRLLSLSPKTCAPL